jgi:hypothetical protein
MSRPLLLKQLHTTHKNNSLGAQKPAAAANEMQ